MDEIKALNALGLSRKANKCVAGDYAVERAVKGQKVYLVTLDSAASNATKQRYRMLCERMEVPYMELNGMGRAIGRPDGRIAAVTDADFAAMIIKNKMPDFGGIYGQN